MELLYYHQDVPIPQFGPWCACYLVLNTLEHEYFRTPYRILFIASLLPFANTPRQVLSNIKVEYEVLAGWEEDISDCKEWDSLPLNAQVYVRRVEVRVSSISMSGG